MSRKPTAIRLKADNAEASSERQTSAQGAEKPDASVLNTKQNKNADVTKVDTSGANKSDSGKTETPKTNTEKDVIEKTGREESTRENPKTVKSSSAKTKLSSRAPRVLPAPSRGEADHDPFDQTPFLGSEDGQRVTTHLPDMTKGIRWGGIMVAAILALFSIGFSLWTVELVEAFFARYPALGWASLGLSALFAVALLGLVLRELLAMRKLRKIGNIRQDAEQVLLNDKPAKPVLKQVERLYASREDMRWHLEKIRAQDAEIMDDADRILLAESALMTPLDSEAKEIIAATARRVSVITALNPSAVLDIIFVGFQVISMLRKLMALYGGRPAFFAAMKLVRMVATHLAVTGGLAVSDTLLQQVLGKGIAGTLSRKLGEGTVNGIMATRIGIAAIDLCRPLPFKACQKPSLKGFVAELVGMG